MHTAGPERQPGFHAALLTCVSSKFPPTIACNRCLHCPAEVHVIDSKPRHAADCDIAHGCFQQTIFVPEIVADIPVETPARRAICAIVASCMPLHLLLPVWRRSVVCAGSTASQFGHFRHSIHQRCLSIKAVLIGRSI